MKKTIIFGIFLLISSFSSYAIMNVYDFESQQEEQRFDSLIRELRCPKCQNNNLADSNAPLATDIKKYVYKSVTNGKKDKEIKDFLISRYGEFITYKPKFSGLGILIWLLPFLLVLTAIISIVYALKNKKKTNIDNTNLKSMKDVITDYENNKTKEQK